MKTKQIIRTKYKIVPVYSKDFKCIGYSVLERWLIGWYRTKMYQNKDTEDCAEVDNFFKTYEEAMTFIKHLTTIINNEEVSDNTNN